MTDTAPAAPPHSSPPAGPVPAGRIPLPSATGEDAHPPGSPGTWSGLRPLLLRLHFYAGILMGPFLLTAAVTGLLYTATPQIESVVYGHELKVSAQGAREPLAAQVEAARLAVPGGHLVSVTRGAGATDSTRVAFDVKGLPEGDTRTAFVNPYNGQVLGTLHTTGEWLPVRAWFDSLHRTLHLGDLGRNYSELAASWLWVEVAGGLALWIGAPRTRQRLRKLFVAHRGPTGRGRTLSWHGVVGLWVSVGFLALSATGLTWSAHAGANIGKIQDSLGGSTPAVSTMTGHHEGSGSRSGSGTTGKDVGIDAVARTADEAGLRGKLVLTPPTDGKSAYVVKENTRHWPERQDSIAVDPATGKVTETLRFDDYPLLAKLTRWGVDAHMGLLFGLANQIVLALIAIALLGMVLWGYRMWWLRRPVRATGLRPGRTPARGTWRRVPGRVMAPLVVVVAVLAYYLPLFGLPLVCFLLGDLVVAAVRRRKETAR
ncbi:PepSY domain-containing protein [Streptomyces sp. NPDC006649]|uniref:PepSY-associated TM helix domain-containing protein n=1 Tax=Streptomyces sp. NPDC006649 TaxID=3156896 RepID=UPI0033AED498